MKQAYNLIKAVLEEEMGCRKAQPVNSFSGGLNHCAVFESDKGKFFVKINAENLLPMYEAERRSLQAIKDTNTLRVPEPLYCTQREGYSFLFLEYITLRPHTPASQKELGTLLAKMHTLKGSEKFGFDSNNTIGTTPQNNTWTDNWVEFFQKYRLEPQLQWIEEKKGDSELVRKGRKFMENFPAYFKGVTITPSLLHGDLWSGNTAADECGSPIVFDPAAYYGHHEAEFGILLLFGGFSQDFHEAYRALIPKIPGFDERQAGYQLYHYLNHYNIFGRSYRPSCMSLIAKYV